MIFMKESAARKTRKLLKVGTCFAVMHCCFINCMSFIRLSVLCYSHSHANGLLAVTEPNILLAVI